MDSLRDRIAAVQGEHQARANSCLCGWEYDPLIDDSHFDHLADAVIEALALRECDVEDCRCRHRYVTEWSADE